MKPIDLPQPKEGDDLMQWMKDNYEKTFGVFGHDNKESVEDSSETRTDTRAT